MYGNGDELVRSVRMEAEDAPQRAEDNQRSADPVAVIGLEEVMKRHVAPREQLPFVPPEPLASTEPKEETQADHFDSYECDQRGARSLVEDTGRASFVA